MLIDADTPPEIRREILLTQCVEKGWKLYISQFGKVKGTRAEYLQNDLNNRTPFLKRLTLGWEEKLLLDANRWLKIEPRLTSETEARVAVMTANGAYYQVARAIDGRENIPSGYVKAMEGLRALMPWNRTGMNAVTMSQVTVDDLEQAVDYINSRLPKAE